MRSIRLRTLLLGLVIAVFALFSLNGSSLAIGPVVDLSKGDYDMRFLGGGENAYTGEVTSAADFNGDGYQDLLLGAAGLTRDGKTFSGAAYVILGRNTFSKEMTASDADVIVYGKSAFSALGHSGATGDVNDDGIPDIIISADGQTSGRGEVYVILGGSGKFASQTIIDLAANPTQGLALTLVGSESGNRFGRSVASADVNGDGIDDIIVGAYKVWPSGKVEAGAVYVFWGSKDIASDNHKTISANNANVKIFGAEGATTALAVQEAIESLSTPVFTDEISAPNAGIGERLGRSVTVGDVNGDGIADLIMGAYGADVGSQVDAGKVYVLYGGSALTGSIDLATAAVPLVLTGIDGGDQAGFYVASGRINGDLRADILVGAYFAAGPNNNAPQTGEVYVVLGDAFANRTISLSTAHATVYGAQGGDRLGRSLAAAKVSGLAYEDLIVGASRADADGRVDAGIAYVIPAGNLSGQILLSQASNAAVRVLGAASSGATCTDDEEGNTASDCSDEAGRSVAAGDLNGDGALDLIVGALFVNNGSTQDAGAVYVMWGTPKPNLYLPLIHANR
jgi:hypothetical protein